MPGLNKDQIDQSIKTNILQGQSNSLSDIVTVEMIRDAHTRQTILALHGCITEIINICPSINKDNRYTEVINRLLTYGNVGSWKIVPASYDAVTNHKQILQDSLELMKVINEQNFDCNLKKQLYSTLFLLLKKVDKSKFLTQELQDKIDGMIEQLNVNFAEINRVDQVAAEVKIELAQSDLSSEVKVQPTLFWEVLSIEEERKEELASLLDTLEALKNKRKQIADSTRTRNFGGAFKNTPVQKLFTNSSAKVAEAEEEISAIDIAIASIKRQNPGEPPSTELRMVLHSLSRTIRKHSSMSESKNIHKLQAYLKKYDISEKDYHPNLNQFMQLFRSESN